MFSVSDYELVSSLKFGTFYLNLDTKNTLLNFIHERDSLFAL